MPYAAVAAATLTWFDIIVRRIKQRPTNVKPIRRFHIKDLSNFARTLKPATKLCRSPSPFKAESAILPSSSSLYSLI
jgi:hypothetical protein